MDDGDKTDDEFEERFLQCFGLGDPESHTVAKIPVARTPSQPDPVERDELLKRQAKNSPWSVCIVSILKGSFSRTARKQPYMYTLNKKNCPRGSHQIITWI